jgi:hypothetical protein
MLWRSQNDGVFSLCASTAAETSGAVALPIPCIKAASKVTTTSTSVFDKAICLLLPSILPDGALPFGHALGTNLVFKECLKVDDICVIFVFCNLR